MDNPAGKSGPQPSPVSSPASLRIALMGTRGIPARYGGFETFYEQLAPRLVRRGHEVTVYGRPHTTGLRGIRWRDGVRLVGLPSIATKHLDTISHTAASVLHGLTQRYDVVLFCGVGNTPLAWVPKLAGSATVLNVDGADFRRDKWGPFATRYLRDVERVAAHAADAIVADNGAVRQRFADDYGVRALFIPYGASLERDEGREHLDRFGLEPGRYVLWVGRTEPETRVEELIEAFTRLERRDFKLVVVGDAPFARDYVDRLRTIADERVVFTGYQFGDAYRQLSTHAAAYVQTSPTSGTSPALLEQMAIGNAVIARGTDTNAEVVDAAGLTYPPDDAVAGLHACLARLLGDDALRAHLGDAARERVRTAYSWDTVADRYERLFLELCGWAGEATDA